MSKAKRDRSKGCRSDCPLVTLAMVLDGSGFPRRSRVFAGNASEPATLKDMLAGLDTPPNATVVMALGQLCAYHQGPHQKASGRRQRHGCSRTSADHRTFVVTSLSAFCPSTTMFPNADARVWSCDLTGAIACS